ncbi:MAG: SUMF1/EgtB/PvdO family nonheme iron enzyme [Anaerolineales bacterium]|nr:SUMF1/EgtB/PvdO family nonheme iron enzyme [Anaerolineales bacterium]
MKKTRFVIFVYTLTLTFVFSACGAESTPPVIDVTDTSLPPTAAQAPIVPIPPTLEPVALAGPQSGAKMKWVDGSTLIYIPAGDFTMGDNGFDAPAHQVSLDGYWIQQTKVTNRMYEQCVNVGSCTSPAQELGGSVFSNPQYTNHPVIGVTWVQAQTYCGWLQGGLPTEAQWENAARGVNGNIYPWGNAEPACDLLNFGYCVRRTTDVDIYPNGLSPYGLYDLAGNVFEWVSDWYSETFYLESPSANPTGPQNGDYRVVRGSSFESATSQISSAIRRFNEAGDSRRDIGFRCAVAQPQPVAPYCQLSAFVPSGPIVLNGCALPEGEVISQYCSAGDGYAKVQLSFSSVYQVRGSLMQCTEVIENGQRYLNCRGPRATESTNEISVCNPSCTNTSVIAGVSPTCDSGYTLDPATGSCNYTPILSQGSAAGCPDGYLLKERGGQQTCVVGKDANGLCPASLYFDELAGMCVPPNGETSAPYGIDNAALASQTYAGSAAGYNYNENFQCSQAVTGGNYPGCAPGYTFSTDIGACTPAEVQLGGEGCITVRVNTLKCSDPIDTCGQHNDSESRCVGDLACSWNEKMDVCELRKP